MLLERRRSGLPTAPRHALIYPRFHGRWTAAFLDLVRAVREQGGGLEASLLELEHLLGCSRGTVQNVRNEALGDCDVGCADHSGHWVCVLYQGSHTRCGACGYVNRDRAEACESKRDGQACGAELGADDRYGWADRKPIYVAGPMLLALMARLERRRRGPAEERRRMALAEVRAEKLARKMRMKERAQRRAACFPSKLSPVRARSPAPPSHAAPARAGKAADRGHRGHTLPPLELAGERLERPAQPIAELAIARFSDPSPAPPEIQNLGSLRSKALLCSASSAQRDGDTCSSVHISGHLPTAGEETAQAPPGSPGAKRREQLEASAPVGADRVAEPTAPATDAAAPRAIGGGVVGDCRERAGLGKLPANAQAVPDDVIALLLELGGGS